MIANASVPLEQCPACATPRAESVFCGACGAFLLDATGSTFRATFTRRFFGSWFLEGVLVLVTLVIGWVIWFALKAKDSQTPAKGLTNLYVINVQTGRAVGAGQMWLREIVIKLLLVGAVGTIIPFASLVDAIWVFFDKDRQALHDKIVKQVVVYAPRGLPEQLAYVPGPYVPPGNPLEGMAIGGSKSSAPATGDRLRELQRLHSEGVLNDEEYEEKRKGLMDQL